MCGIGSLFVFRHLAGRLLQGIAFLLAVGVFAVAYPLIRYSAEAKPYGPDMLVSLALLTLTVEWLRQPGDSRWWWALIAAMPLAVLLSYPAVFVAGGISLTLAVVLVRQGSWREWLRWGLCNAALCGGLAVGFGFCTVNQMRTSGRNNGRASPAAFPPLTSPRDLAVFLWVNHTGETIPYPIGERNGASLLTTICCLTALVCWCAAGSSPWPRSSTPRWRCTSSPPRCTPIPMATTSDSSSISVGLLPAHGPGRGGDPRAAAQPPLVACRAGKVALALLVAIAVGISGRDFWKPYKDKCFLRDRDFARWFWPEKSFNAELVCLQSDWHKYFYTSPQGNDLREATTWPRSSSATSGFTGGRPGRLDKPDAPRQPISKTHPLRCVRYKPVGSTPRDEAEFRRWLASMQANQPLQLVRQDAYPIPFWRKGVLAEVGPCRGLRVRAAGRAICRRADGECRPPWSLVQR